MINENALLLVLLGLIAYRSLDYFAAKFKLEQTLLKANAIKLTKGPLSTRPRILSGICASISKEALFSWMVALVMIFSALGVFQIAETGVKPAVVTSNLQQLLAVMTLFISLGISTISLIIEALRFYLEKS